VEDPGDLLGFWRDCLGSALGNCRIADVGMARRGRCVCNHFPIIMGSLLYQEGRYQDVIDLGGKLANTPATRRAEYWLYLAAAFGQKYHALKGTAGAPQTELDAARANALDGARRAVRADPSMKARLCFISDPDGDDDDLQDFRTDDEFLGIIGRRNR